ncbi:hypothetical protein TRFO_31562 [Tritrichomonas foetus]|uniref:Uncharacterized protein n=1 Tax=Tritrichomonas foetus TaxID=1144522 RepID=A0A1J4JR77_9EUKA|nr:hypothetical protein TRFO_31562 [Tritrichomonas foetus]|eukprot:OHT01539.1 hypothetical protein TRFO_31562 [Tritrichomonas foetus]
MTLSEDNKVLMWGKNDDGQLGVSDKENRYKGFIPSIVSGDAETKFPKEENYQMKKVYHLKLKIGQHSLNFIE